MAHRESQTQTDGFSPKINIPQNTPVRVTTYPTRLEKTDPKSATDKTNMVYATTVIRPNPITRIINVLWREAWAEKAVCQNCDRQQCYRCHQIHTHRQPHWPNSECRFEPKNYILNSITKCADACD